MPGRIFRGAAPVAPGHASALSAVGIRRVFDLRTQDERAMRPLDVPDGVAVHRVDLLGDGPHGPATLGGIAKASMSGEGGRMSAAQMRAAFLHGYRDFVSSATTRRRTRAVLTALADPGEPGGPALIHCTAGKDRTGWIAALVLEAAGVTRDDVMADYLASGPEVAHMFAPFRQMLLEQGADVSAFDTAIGVREEYLAQAWAELDSTYGSVDMFLERGLLLPHEFRDLLVSALVVPA
jgi:protein-tyrosine phosphatase